MKYMLLIYNSEAEHAKFSEAQLNAEMEGYMAFGSLLRERGGELVGEALNETSTATSVQVRDGKTLTTDGPFAETHEQLGGFYVVDCKDLDEAIELAAKIPGAKYGTIEVRPVWDFSAVS